MLCHVPKLLLDWEYEEEETVVKKEPITPVLEKEISDNLMDGDMELFEDRDLGAL